MKNTPNVYYAMMMKYREAELLFEAIKLNVFSYMDEPVTLDDICMKTNYNRHNMKIFLSALVSCQHVIEEEGLYINSPLSMEYLSRNSKTYIGDAILYRNEMSSLSGLQDKVMNGTSDTGNVYDFSKLAEVTWGEMYATGRVRDFLAIIRDLYKNDGRKYKILDLGCGNGVLPFEFKKVFPESEAYIFETPEVADAIEKIYKKNNVKDINIITGDFNRDSLGENYDLIIASGILNFVKGDMANFTKKLSRSLSNDGYLMVVGSYVKAGVLPKFQILNWMRGYMSGVRETPEEEMMNESMELSGLEVFSHIKIGLFTGYLYKKVLNYGDE